MLSYSAPLASASRPRYPASQCCTCLPSRRLRLVATGYRNLSTSCSRFAGATEATSSTSSTSHSDRAQNAGRFAQDLSKKRAELQQRLASTSAQWRSSLLARTAELSTEAKARLAILNARVNEATGYLEVERLKHKVLQRENTLSESRDSAKAAKVAYDSAVAARSTAQQDVNSLLERKHSWTEDDVSRFTKLVRSDHASGAAVIATSEQLKVAEAAVDKAFSDLTQSILERYHEEQVWSDRIRNISTYAGVAGLIINLIVFVGAIAFVEPWKRRRLVERLEERLAGMMSAVEGKIQDLSSQVAPFIAEEGASSHRPAELPLVPLPAPSMSLPVLQRPSALPRVDPLVRYLDPYLDPIASRSPDRDAAVVAVLGGCVGILLASLTATLMH